MIPKFRAWNKDDKEMIDVRVIDWNNMTVDSFSPWNANKCKSFPE